MTVNLLAVVITAVAAMAIGFVWYSMSVFGKMWMKETGLTMEEIGDGPGVGYLITTVAAGVMGAAMGLLIKFTGTTTVADALAWGLVVGVGFIGTSFLTNSIFERKTFKLILIDAGYFVVLAPVAAVIAVLVR